MTDWTGIFAILGIVATMLLLHWMDRVDARLATLEQSSRETGANE